jgi:hypothetical protein
MVPYIKIKMRAGRERFNPFSDKIELAYIVYNPKTDTHSAAQPLTIQPLGDDEPTPSFCTLTREQAQLLMDDLWNCGLRPSEGSGSAGAMKAVQEHLADMKKILFHKMEIKE